MIPFRTSPTPTKWVSSARSGRASTRAQRNHIGFAPRAFVRSEWHRYTTGVTGFHATCGITRDAVRADLMNPIYNLPESATA